MYPVNMEPKSQNWMTSFFLHMSIILLLYAHLNQRLKCVFASPVCNLQEYETQSSPEARLVKQFDLAEMILQAHEYEQLEGSPGRLQEFFDSTNGELLSLFCPGLRCVSHLVLTSISLG